MKTGWKTSWGAVLMAAVLVLSFAPAGSEAKRLGGGKSLGVQRSVPPQQGPAAQPNGPPATPAANPVAPAGGLAGAAAATPKRSWMGPLAGLAAGLGIGALLAHLGLGGGFASLLTALLLAAAAFFVIRFLVRRFGRSAGSTPGLQFAGAGHAAPRGGSGSPARVPAGTGGDPMRRNAEPSTRPAASGLAAGAPVSLAKLDAKETAGGSASTDTPTAPDIPADFDTAGFERIAKMIFIRLQAANDKADLTDLRHFTTPEMFASIRLDLQERGPSTQQTDVAEVNAQVTEVATDGGQQIVSVRFHGLIREDLDGSAGPFDEVWHLVKPAGGPDSAWAIAGIQQRL